ncbi:MAG: hypothetical protein EA414_19490 [Arthrospira sp. PLM2.Bin9]|nr:hypothetical protein [Arthrospira sp. PLM2.Bin9]TVU52072.1 MAG: hypothetical protein EA414_19490 [Arthrospira sp. PLM2.Bin9]
MGVARDPSAGYWRWVKGFPDHQPNVLLAKIIKFWIIQAIAYPQNRHHGDQFWRVALPLSSKTSEPWHLDLVLVSLASLEHYGMVAGDTS